MNLEELFNMMEELLDGAMQVPFSGKKSLIDIEKMRDLITEVRLALPNEIRQAQDLVKDRKTIIADAKREADGIIKKAEEKAAQLTMKQEITRLAQQKANEIMVSAQQKSKELRNTTNDYVDNMLNEVEGVLTHDLAEIKRARSALKHPPK